MKLFSKTKFSTELLSDASIRDWLQTRDDPTGFLDNAPHIDTPEKARRAVEDICIVGVHEHKHFAVPTEPTWLKRIAEGKGTGELNKLTNLIGAEAAANANERFEILMSLRPHYGPKPPVLSLGTLLRSTTDAEGLLYWLCIQPACDCYIRTAERRRAFPLLKLAPTNDRFNILVQSDNAFVRLRWHARPHLLQMIEFEANSPSGAVSAITDQGKFILTSAMGKQRFQWLGQLKFAQAQRVAHALASEAARVGLTESEWLRRNAK